MEKKIDSVFLIRLLQILNFLIINDGSIDKTAEILKSYNDPRIKIINNEKNIGLTKSLNKGLKLTRGEYIARQDADDVSMPERLEKEVEFLEQNKNVGLVGTEYFMINEKGMVVHIVRCLNECKELKAKLLEGNQFGHGSVMFRKECKDKVGTYREEFKFAQDFDFYLRIAEVYDIVNISEPLYKWRINIESVSVKKKALQDKYALLAIELAKERRQLGKDKLQSFKKEEINILLDDIIPKSTLQDKKEIAQNYFFWSITLLNGKDYKSALHLLSKSFFAYPLCISNLILFFKTLIINFLPKQIIKSLKSFKKYLFLQ